MKVFYSIRVIHFQTGEVIALPAGVYEDEATCKHEGEETTRHIGELARISQLCQPVQGANGETGMRPIGKTLQGFLAELGVKGVGHNCLEMPVQSKIAVVSPKIILPGRIN